jgi:hypothetical protein
LSGFPAPQLLAQDERILRAEVQKLQETFLSTVVARKDGQDATWVIIDDRVYHATGAARNAFCRQSIRHYVL